MILENDWTPIRRRWKSYPASLYAVAFSSTSRLTAKRCWLEIKNRLNNSDQVLLTFPPLRIFIYRIWEDLLIQEWGLEWKGAAWPCFGVWCWVCRPASGPPPQRVSNATPHNCTRGNIVVVFLRCCSTVRVQWKHHALLYTLYIWCNNAFFLIYIFSVCVYGENKR